jgi:hypothetical protein
MDPVGLGWYPFSTTAGLTLPDSEQKKPACRHLLPTPKNRSRSVDQATVLLEQVCKGNLAEAEQIIHGNIDFDAREAEYWQRELAHLRPPETAQKASLQVAEGTIHSS